MKDQKDGISKRWHLEIRLLARRCTVVGLEWWTGFGSAMRWSFFGRMPDEDEGKR